MKREIKFRAWQPLVKKMWQWHEMEEYLIFEIFKSSDGDEMIPLQFTGLHDRNGKEIYEGDIVKWTDFADDGFGGSHAIEVEERVWFGGGAFYPVCNMPSTNYEVIGNIYENE